METIRNKVAESDVEVFNLEDFWTGGEVCELDLSEFLVEGLLLKEKDFRSRVKETDWTAYAGRHVAVTCSTDAIVPTWAYMLIASKLTGIAVSVAPGTAHQIIRDHFVRALESFDWEKYRDGIVVVKGCGSRLVPQVAYTIATQELKRVAKKVMYGEPCSSVPIWREKKKPPASSDHAKGAKKVEARLPSGGS